MRKVYKYEIQPDGLTVDAAIRPIHVAAIDSRLYLWAEHYEHGYARKHLFFAYPTGHMTIPNDAEYVGTVLMHNGNLVWHVYELDGRRK